MRNQIWESAVLCWRSTWFGHIRLVTFGDPDSRFPSLLKVTDFIKSHQEASFSCWKIHCKEHRSRLNLMGCMEKNHQSTRVGPCSIQRLSFARLVSHQITHKLGYQAPWLCQWHMWAHVGMRAALPSCHEAACSVGPRSRSEWMLSLVEMSGKQGLSQR